MVLLGVATGKAPPFGCGLAMFAIGLGVLRTIGAVIAIVDPGSAFSAVSVLAIVVFDLAVGWRTLKLGTGETVDLTDTTPVARPAPTREL